MKLRYLIITGIILSIFSCEKEKIKKIGHCYIQENQAIKFLDKTATGIIDTVELKSANAENFEVISDSSNDGRCFSDVWAKDKMSIWYKQYKISGADPFTFKVLNNSYSNDKNNVFYKQNLLVNAVKEHFKILNNFYAKDNERIWYKGKEVFGINDVTNFEVIDGYFSTDGKNIYMNNDTVLLKIPDSDANTFIGIEDDMHLSSLKYYKDKRNVYCIDTEKNIGEPDFLNVFDAFTESFTILNEKYYSKDNFNIYYKNKVIENADRNTFSAFGKNYSKDNSKIFFKNKIIYGAEYNSFQLIDNDTIDAIDSLSCYLLGKRTKR
ncbi:MAG: DKNYY domain-containing protein [Bacteroidales bacterium]|nr:DKNYY domain-containing protein [Bacteroidales bacterium]